MLGLKCFVKCFGSVRNNRVGSRRCIKARMPRVAVVDVPKWCVAEGLTVITPATAYADILRTSRQLREFFAHTP